jgi:hypothetical protein
MSAHPSEHVNPVLKESGKGWANELLQHQHVVPISLHDLADRALHTPAFDH